ncbi:MAG TPA: AMP-binding protein [Kineosporiaceae bacterium]
MASKIDRRALLARELGVLFRAGVLAPTAPPVAIRQLLQLKRYGPTLGGAYSVAAHRAPWRCAVADETCSRTFAELDERVRAVVRGLVARGIGPHDTVAVLGRNSVPFVEALVAASRLGSDAVLLSTFLSPGQTRDVLLRERCRVVFADPELLPLLEHRPEGVLVVALRSGTAVTAAGYLTLDALMADGDDPRPSGRRGRLVVLTSGTTGTPKGARRPAPSSLGPAAAVLSRLRLTSRDTIMISSPLFHTWGLGMLQIASALTATVVVRERADPEVVLDAISRTRATALIAVPVILERVLHLPGDVRAGYDVSRLRAVASSGSALGAALAREFQDEFGDVLYNVYGSTEISWATIATPADLRVAPGTAGRPPLGTRLEIVDDAGRPVGRGTVGRIFVGHELLFEGYTAAPGTERLHGLMATGDRGYLDPDGRLMVVGREDDLVISGAEKIYPREVEEVILALPEVREVVVTGRPDPEMGQRLVAFVVRHEGAGLTVEDVQNHVRGRLARFAVPRAVTFLDELPRTPTGKVVPRLLPGGQG